MWTHTQSTHPHACMYILMHPVISAQFHPPFRLWATRLIHLHTKGERAATRGTSVERNGWEWVIWCLTEFAFHAKIAKAISRCGFSQESLCRHLARRITSPSCFFFCPVLLYVCGRATKRWHLGAYWDPQWGERCSSDVHHTRGGACQGWSLWQVYPGLWERRTIGRRLILPVRR